MNIGEVSTREVCTIRREEPLAVAAREMRKRHCGTVVVIELQGEAVRPVGIITDRDIVCGQVKHAADLSLLTVADVMTSNPFTLLDKSGIAEAIGRMSDRAVRRAPVVNDAGELVGIVSIDDLLPILAKKLGALATLIGRQARGEHESG